MKVDIIEVGPRDGLQNEATKIDVKTRIDFIENLIRAGHQEIEIGAFVSPKAVPQMSASDEVAKALVDKYQDLNLMALVPNKQGYERAKVCGVRSISLVTAASETFNRKNLNATTDESIARMHEFVGDAKNHNIFVRGYISTAFYCPYEGVVNSSRVLDLVMKLQDLGVNEISLGDTIGMAKPHEVFALIEKVEKLWSLKNTAMHFHDTRGTALANVFAALEAGISRFDSSAGGLGGCPFAPGATGNLATEDLVFALLGSRFETGIDLKKQTDASFALYKKLNRDVSSRYLQAERAN